MPVLSGNQADCANFNGQIGLIEQYCDKLDPNTFGGVVTNGSISALSGLRDRLALSEISAPIQAGNSGGPLLDTNGSVVGVITASLGSRSRDVPQNVNFALKTDVAPDLPRFAGVPIETSSGGRDLSVADIGEKARAFSVLSTASADRKTRYAQRVTLRAATPSALSSSLRAWPSGRNTVHVDGDVDVERAPAHREGGIFDAKFGPSKAPVRSKPQLPQCQKLPPPCVGRTSVPEPAAAILLVLR